MIKEIINKIEKNNENIEKGIITTIPFPFQKLYDTIPGISKGDFTIITASSGVGKTQLTKYMYVLHPLFWIKNNDADIKYKIIYFALEESEEEFAFSFISNILYQKYKIKIPVIDLMQVKNNKIEKDVLEKIKSIEKEFEYYFSNIELFTQISRPSQILKKIKEFSNKRGQHFYYNYIRDPEKKNIITEAEYLKREDKHEYSYLKYVPYEEKEIVCVIIDHISLLSPENGETLHQTISRMSSDIGRKFISKGLKYSLVFVQQQSAEKEREQYTMSGDKIEEKLIPSLDGLADNKLTQRDALNVIGLFAPNRYNIKIFQNYDIRYLGDNFRTLEVLKSRYGRSSIRIPLYYNGKINYFYEMPPYTYFNYDRYVEFARIHGRKL